MKPEYITLSRECLRKLNISGYTLIDSVLLKEKYGIELFKTVSHSYGPDHFKFKILNLGTLTFAKIKYGF